MKHFLFLIFTSVFCLNCQSQIGSVDSYIKKLDNKQFTIVHEEKAMFSMQSKPALALIKKGKHASQKLILALNDSSKVIMAHLILCHIYFNVATFAGPKIITVNDKHIANYFLGQKGGEGLIISEIKDNGNYKTYIEPKNLEAIKLFWKNKIAEKSK